MKNRRTVTRALAVLGTAAVLAGTTQTSHAATSDTPAERAKDTATVAAYTAYMAKKVATREEGAEQAYKEFTALSSSEKVKYLDYLNNPEVLKQFLQEAAEPEPGPDPTAATPVTAPAPGPAAAKTTFRSTESSRSLFNGDVVIEGEQEATFTPDTTEAAPGESAEATRGKLSRGTWESKYTFNQKILGVTVTRLSVWVNYYTNGSKITKVNFADGGKRNFNAAVSISKSTPKHWKDGSYANGSVVWEGSIIYKGFGVNIDKRQKVWANEYGYRGGYLKNI